MRKRLAIAVLAVLATPALSAGAAEPLADGAVPVTVRMTDGLQFKPARITVRVGQRIRWRNVGSVAHTITTQRSKASRPSDASVPRGAKPWDSGFVGAGESYQRVLRVPGIYRYFCIPHEAARMVGTIVVKR